MYVSQGILTVKTNRDRRLNRDQDWDFSICLDQLLKLQQNYTYCQARIFFVSVETFKIKTFQLRLSCDFHQDCQDKFRLSRFSRFVETLWDFQDISTLLRLFEVLQVWKSWQIEKSESRNMKKLINSWWRSRQTDKICQKFQISRSWSRLLGLEGGVKTKSRFLNLDLRLLNCRDKIFEIVKIFWTAKTYFLPVFSKPSPWVVWIDFI